MLLRVSGAWCVAVTALLLAMISGFQAIEGLYAGIYAARDDARTVPWAVVATYPHLFPHGAFRETVLLSGSVCIEQSFQPETDQYIAGIEVHAVPSAPRAADRPWICRWALFESSGGPTPLREGTGELVRGYGFLKIYFPPLTVRADRDYEFVLHGPGDGNPHALAVPLFHVDQPWGVLRIRESSAGVAAERTNTCLRMRLMETPPQE